MNSLKVPVNKVREDEITTGTLDARME